MARLLILCTIWSRQNSRGTSMLMNTSGLTEDKSETITRQLARKRMHFISELLRLNLDSSVGEEGILRVRHVELAREQLEEIKELLNHHPDLKFHPLEKCGA